MGLLDAKNDKGKKPASVNPDSLKGWKQERREVLGLLERIREDLGVYLDLGAPRRLVYDRLLELAVVPHKKPVSQLVTAASFLYRYEDAVSAAVLEDLCHVFYRDRIRDARKA